MRAGSIGATRVSASSFVISMSPSTSSTGSTPTSAILATGSSRLERSAPVAEEVVAEAETPLGLLVDFKDGVGTVVLSTANPRDALEAAGLEE